MSRAAVEFSVLIRESLDLTFYKGVHGHEGMMCCILWLGRDTVACEPV